MILISNDEEYLAVRNQQKWRNERKINMMWAYERNMLNSQTNTKPGVVNVL